VRHLGGGPQRAKVVGVRQAVGGVRDLPIQVLVEESLGVAEIPAGVAGVNLRSTWMSQLLAHSPAHFHAVLPQQRSCSRTQRCC
jgi:hypothetical protein